MMNKSPLLSSYKPGYVSVGRGSLNSSQRCDNPERAQLLEFPATRSVLWDHQHIGPPSTIHITNYRNPVIVVEEKILRILQRYSQECNSDTYRCMLVGSLTTDTDGCGVVVNIDRLDTGRRSDDHTLCIADLTYNEVTIPCLVKSNSAKPSCSVSDYESAISLGCERCTAKVKLDVGHFLAIRANCSYHCNNQSLIFHMDFDLVVAVPSFKASPVNCVPIVPTALSKNLQGPMSLSDVQGEPKSGYLTMDQTRKLLLILESDPKINSLPLVGIWTSGIANIHDPFIWTACLRYIFNKTTKERICQPPEPFLIVMYSPLRSRPEFYDCVPFGGQTKLDFSLYSCHEVVQLSKEFQSRGLSPVEMELLAVEQGEKKDIFDVALQNSKDKWRLTAEDTQDAPNRRLSGSMEEITPRRHPAPHQITADMLKPSVPEVSFLLDDITSQPDPFNFHNQHEQLQGSKGRGYDLSVSSGAGNMPGISQQATYASGTGVQNTCSGYQLSSSTTTYVPAQYMQQPQILPERNMPNTVAPPPWPCPQDGPYCSKPYSHYMPPNPQYPPQYPRQPPWQPPIGYPGHYHPGAPYQNSGPPPPGRPYPQGARPHMRPPALRNTSFRPAIPSHAAFPPQSSHLQTSSSNPSMPQALQPLRQEQLPVGNNNEKDTKPPSPQYAPVSGLKPDSGPLRQLSIELMSPKPTVYVPVSSQGLPQTGRSGLNSTEISPVRNSGSTDSGLHSNDSGDSGGHLDQSSTSTCSHVPVEVYERLREQDEQLRSLREQLALLLAKQSDSLSETAQSIPSQKSNDAVEKCSIAVNTTLLDSYQAVDGFPVGKPNHLNTSDMLQSSQTRNTPRHLSNVNSSREINASSSQQHQNRSHPTSSNPSPQRMERCSSEQFPSPIASEVDRGAVSSETLSFGEFQLTHIEDRSQESMTSEMCVDLPDYTSMSPEKFGDNITACGYPDSDRSPILGESVSMYEQDGMLGNMEQSSDAEQLDISAAIHEQKQFYKNLIGNVHKLLARHSGGEDTLDTTENVTYDGEKVAPQGPGGEGPIATYNMDHYELEERAHIEKSINIAEITRRRLQEMGVEIQDCNSNDTTKTFESEPSMFLKSFMLPKVNYMSMMFDSDESDLSHDANALAMKYLTDEQLSALAQQRLTKPRQKHLDASLNHVGNRNFNSSKKSDVSMYGISSNHMSFATQKYLERYGLSDARKELEKPKDGQREPILRNHPALANVQEYLRKLNDRTGNESLLGQQPRASRCYSDGESFHSDVSGSGYPSASSDITNNSWRRSLGNVQHGPPAKGHRRSHPPNPVQLDGHFGDGDGQTAHNVNSPANDRVLDIERLKKLPKLL